MWKLLCDCVWWLNDEQKHERESTHKGLYGSAYVHYEKALDVYILYLIIVLQCTQYRVYILENIWLTLG